MTHVLNISNRFSGHLMQNRSRFNSAERNHQRTFHIRLAKIEDASQIATVFDAYRIFYNQHSDLNLALNFIKNRITRNESVIVMALDNSSAELLGIAQLYTGFSSLGAYHYTIFNDLYVISSARKSGVASALIAEVDRLSSESGSKKIVLETKPDNHRAQSLYIKAGYQKQPSGINDEYCSFVKLF